jgi:hypothetical protein
VIAFLGPTIPAADAPLVKFDPTSHQGPLMNTSGGRRRRRATRRNAKKPRTKKTKRSSR